jgi:trigger factor
MKKRLLNLCFIFIITFSILLLFGCNKDYEPIGRDGSKTSSESSGGANVPAAENPFSYSEGIDANGFWQNIRALDLIEQFDFHSFGIPSHIHFVSDSDVQREIDGILSYYPSSERITDRPVVSGDKVNIDYVGSIDGIEFAGGNTGGRGADVTAGSREYIADFLDQIIGYMPGDTVNVEVTFPDDYHAPDLAGKDALFVTVINYIKGDEIAQELTDEFVFLNLSNIFGWTTVAEMENEIRSDKRVQAVNRYITQFISDSVEVKSVPDSLIRYHERLLTDNFTNYASSNGFTVGELLDIEGFSSMEELLREYHDEHVRSSSYFLVIQAVAESAGITVSDDDVAEYFAEHFGSGDISMYEEAYGMPYLKQYVLSEKVIGYIADNAVLLD